MLYTTRNFFFPARNYQAPLAEDEDDESWTQTLRRRSRFSRSLILIVVDFAFSLLLDLKIT